MIWGMRITYIYRSFLFTDCYHEITTQSGQIISKNYPTDFSDKKDCIFVIKPGKSIATNTEYILTIEGLRYQYDRNIEV